MIEALVSILEVDGDEVRAPGLLGLVRCGGHRLALADLGPLEPDELDRAPHQGILVLYPVVPQEAGEEPHGTGMLVAIKATTAAHQAGAVRLLA